jgi:hypothetical protein
MSARELPVSLNTTFSVPIPLPYMWYLKPIAAEAPKVIGDDSKIALSPPRLRDASMYK